MRVLFLSDYDPFVSETGPGAVQRGLSQSLCRLGCEVHILVLNPSACARVLSENSNRVVNGVQLHYVSPSVNPFLRTRASTVPVARDCVFAAISLREVARLCREYRMDIIHGMSPAGYAYGFLRRSDIPFVITQHATAFGEFLCYFDIPLSFINGNLVFNAMGEMLATFQSYLYHKCKCADKFITVSKADAEELVRFYCLPEERFVAIHNGIDLSSFTDLRAEEEGEEHTILSVGRLEWRKGYKYLIDAMPNVLSEYTSAKLLVVGVGDQKAHLQRHARKLGIENSVLFLGKVSAERLYSLYHEAEVYVQPSLYEPFGITILEAMSMRKPVVATRVGGIPEIITNGVEGLLVEPGDSLQLAKATTNLFSDSSSRRRLSTNARKRVEREFTWEAIAKKTLEFYTNLLNDR